MKNEQIIYEAAVSIWGEDAVQDMIMSGKDIPLHTVQGWKARGNYYVRKGERGLQARLWKRKKGRKVPDGSEPGEDPAGGGFYLTKAYLFTEDQMVKVED